jgi:hypothetical protein
MIVAIKSLNPGDVIAIEEPLFKSLEVENENCTKCSNCLHDLNEKITCTLCNSITYCSLSCEQKAWIDFHEYECDSFSSMDSDDGYLLMADRMLSKSISICEGFDNLRTTLENLNETTTVFSENENKTEKFLLKCCYNLECGNTQEDFKFAHMYAKDLSKRSQFTQDADRKFLKQIVAKIFGILNRNSFCLELNNGKAIAGALFAFTSLINHSCTNNLDGIVVENRLMLIVNQPIKKGQQIFLCYHKPFYMESIKDRRSKLMMQFNFFCQCEACVNPCYSTVMVENFDVNKDKKSSDDILREYKENCKYIMKNFSSYPSLDIVERIRKNKLLLNFLT